MTEAPSPEERRSCIVFSVVMGLVMMAVVWPDMPAQLLLGILWTTVGGLLLGLPPTVRIPRVWLWLAVGFVLTAAAGFLPREWFGVSQWRRELEKMGLDTGTCSFVQPQLAAEGLAALAVTAVVGLALLGHRVGTRLHQRLLLAFSLGVGCWTVLALVLPHAEGHFGFFPNRNHSATLLAMGAVTSLCGLAQAIRFREGWKIALSIPPLALCLGALFMVSTSRGGMVLVVFGLAAWLLLTGIRHLRGHTGRAVSLLVVGFVGLFLIMDSPVKSRLKETVERIDFGSAPATSGPRPDQPFDTPQATATNLPFDNRLTIFKEVLGMAAREPWTGVGPGQFAVVFPQYRNLAPAENEFRFLHPESDWLLMLTETGPLATLCLLAAVVLVASTAIRRAWTSDARPLRMGSLVAALLLAVHGLFDVPGHRVGLAWAALLLMALALRPRRRNDRRGELPASAWSRLGWRSTGLVLAVAGLTLLQARFRGTAVLPSAAVAEHMAQAKALYDADQAAYDKATAEGRDYQPTPANDPLEQALGNLAQVVAIMPLEPHPHYIRGVLALHFDDKLELVGSEFAQQRFLDPTRVNAVMEQAAAWQVTNPRESLPLWQEALRRAAAEQERFPTTQSNVIKTFDRIRGSFGKDEQLRALTLTLTEPYPELLPFWAGAAPVALLDREMPRLIPAAPDPAGRNFLFSIWIGRSSKQAADFAAAHPELNLGKQ